MDGQPLTYLFGATSILIGAALLYKLFKPTQNGVRWLSNKKIVIPLIILLIGNGLYDISNPESGRYIIGDDNWTSDKKKALVETCMLDAKPNSEKYPEIIRTYCECSMEKISENQKYTEYLSTSKKSKEEQIKILVPVFKDCYKTMRTQIAMEENKAN